MEKERALKTVSVSNFGFEKLIANGGLYIDKTEYISRILENRIDCYYFLSRPRRFGKSLTVSLLESLFRGEKELFKGLYIEDKWNFEETYPVLHFCMSDLNGRTLTENRDILTRRVKLYAEKYGIDDSMLGHAKTPGVLFSNLIESIHMKTGKQVVVLIDEYDYPLLEHIKGRTFESYRNMMESFYSPLKTRQNDIRFCFITGITRFSQVSIFSKLNNLIDISDDPDYAAICGYTDEEIDRYFTPYFEKYFEESGITSDEEKAQFRNRVREYYDGYKFTLDSDVTLYNPVSIGKFVSAKCRKFDNYWIGTGAQSIVRELVQSHIHLFNREENFIINNADSMKTFEAHKFFFGKPTQDSVYSFLKQAGYLTLEGMEERKVVLCYPNVEVASTMVATVMEAMGLEGASRLTAQDAATALAKGNTGTLISCIKDLLALYPYDLTLEKEKGFQIVLYSFFLHILKDVRVEEHTATGRMDLLIRVRDDFYYILELKVDQSAEVALNQIEEMQYYRRLKKPGNTIHLVGINFSSKERNIKDWGEEIIRL